MNDKRFLLVWVVLVGLATGAYADRPTMRLGVGANYWTAVGSIKVDNIDRDGFSWLLSYQHRPGLVGWSAELEWLPDRFGEDALAPAAYLLVGRGFFVAAGVGIVRQDGDWADRPFLALRGGVDMEWLPRLHLELAASYRFDSRTSLEDAARDIDTDTLYLGAAVRMAF